MSDNSEIPGNESQGSGEQSQSVTSGTAAPEAKAKPAPLLNRVAENLPESLKTSVVIDLLEEIQRRARGPGRPKKDPSELSPGRPKKKYEPQGNWRDQLIRTPMLELAPRSIRNAILIIENHDDLRQCFAYDKWRKRPVIMRPLPWHKPAAEDAGSGYGSASVSPSSSIESASKFPAEGKPITDSDLTRIVNFLETQGQKGFSGRSIAEVVYSVAAENPFNPLLDYLNGLKWDGRPRIDTWLNYYLGVEDTAYTRSVSAKYLIAAIARAMKPGSKMDDILILEGPQGLYKSTALKVLFGPEYFTDELSQIGSKDCAMQLQGVWCVEMPELAALERSEIKQIREWLSRSMDRFRPPFGIAVQDYPRQCVVAGTHNPQNMGYLKDSTGNRRFWPVLCTAIDIEALIADRDQLWAEATARYKAGEKWWMSSAQERRQAELAQRERYDEDAWMEYIREYLMADTLGYPRKWTTVENIATDCLRLEKGKFGQREKIRIVSSLQYLGWSRTFRRVNGKALRAYMPNQAWEDHLTEMQAALSLDEANTPLVDAAYTSLRNDDVEL